ncbi:hypothetical protein AX774_g6847 [Zancudomyces culisetae]|uniref:Uncharacterized protein n=1 Tax=Zancudomyces culisetae TaxID=1213189 RepID=A0A1R1PFJ8_ZANCU|nr:hypothetical protein AX774_g6847 [Zancudomyces culisetae]|eukprot:OMH79726.1 hypothetical protein AX774_g6847 [Zancudomyces culisetae]
MSRFSFPSVAIIYILLFLTCVLCNDVYNRGPGDLDGKEDHGNLDSHAYPGKTKYYIEKKVYDIYKRDSDSSASDAKIGQDKASQTSSNDSGVDGQSNSDDISSKYQKNKDASKDTDKKTKGLNTDDGDNTDDLPPTKTKSSYSGSKNEFKDVDKSEKYNGTFVEGMYKGNRTKSGKSGKSDDENEDSSSNQDNDDNSAPTRLPSVTPNVLKPTGYALNGSPKFDSFSLFIAIALAQAFLFVNIYC